MRIVKNTKGKILVCTILSIVMLTSLVGCSAEHSYDAMDSNITYGERVESQASNSFSGFGGNVSPSSANKSEYNDAYVPPSNNGWTESRESFDQMADSSSSHIETSSKTPELNTEKLVYSATIEMEVKEFDKTVETISETIEKHGAFISGELYKDDSDWETYYGNNKENYGRSKVAGYKHLTLYIRVPSENFHGFISGLNGVGHVISNSTSTKNITQEYYSNKAYIESYEKQLEMLQEMYNNATSIKEMIEVQDRIAEVQAQLNKLNTKIISMDRDVAFSEVTLYIDEVDEYTTIERPDEEEPSYFTKLKERLVKSTEDFIEFLEEFSYFVVDIMWFAMIIIIIIIVTCMVHNKKVKNKRKIEQQKIIDAKKFNDQINTNMNSGNKGTNTSNNSTLSGFEVE